MTFTYGDNSDVWIHPTGDCDPTGRTQLGELGPGSATYNFTDADIGTPITFVSSVGDSCANGQIITFTVGKFISEFYWRVLMSVLDFSDT